MMTTKTSAIALLIAATWGAVVGCSSSLDKGNVASKGGEGNTGTVGLTLQPVAGITVNTVHYVVTKAGSTTPVLEGDLPTPGTAATFSFGLPLPVGTGYTVNLSGTAVESATTTCVGSSAPFDVTANTSTTIKLVLTCTDASTGSVNGGVTVQTDSCPHLIVDYVVATPSAADLRGRIAVTGAAHDLDGKPITYAWQISDPAVGAFAPANAASSVFTCGLSGLNLSATLTANNGECSKELSTKISCADATCGNGRLDTGEQCDPTIPVGQPGFGPCPANCHFTCGNGIVEAPVEQCDPVPADPIHCSRTCQIIPGECGNGFLEPGEQCDGNLFPPGAPTANRVCDPNTCVVIIVDPPICGNRAKEPGELCDPAFTVEDCGSDCHAITKASCVACENANGNCPSTSCDNVVGNAAAGPAVGTPRAQLCNQVLDCVRDSGCSAGQNLPIKCYCGTANPTQCSQGNGNGPCKAQLEAGLETTDFNTIASRFGNTTFGGGKAMDRINCDQTFCDNTPNGQPSSATNPSECF